MGQNKLDEALIQFQSLQSVQANPSDTRTKIGLIYYEKGDFERAATEFGLVLAADPENDQVRYYLGATYAEMKDQERALEVFSLISEESKYFADSRIQLASIYERRGEPSKAIESVEAAMEKRKDRKGLLGLLSSLHRKAKDYPKAIEALKELVALNPKSDQAHFRLGALYDESKNKDKTAVTLNPELLRIQAMIEKFLTLIGTVIPLSHLVLDCHFGNHPALHMVRACGLHLISKLRHDAALYFSYKGPYAGRGPRRKYGSKLDYTHIPLRYLKQSSVEDNIQTDIYQVQVLHKEFAQPLNVGIIVKTNLKTHKRAHAVLFSSDLDLDYAQLIDDYSLRFQIEFNFRDAKQYWGLEDFMNVQQTAVHNAANLSLFMVNVAHVLLRPFRRANPQFGVLDMKAYFRGHKYVAEILKLLPENPEPIIMEQIIDRIAGIGSIHSSVPVLSSS